MHTRTRAAGTALVFAAAVSGVAATSGSAQATTHHPVDRSSSIQTVKITSHLKTNALSKSTIHPGNTLFKVSRGNAGGSMQLLRLKKGYSLQQASQDFGGLFSGDVKAVRRVDNNVVFYGGMDVPGKGVTKPNQWGVNLDKTGTYYVLNIGGSRGQLAVLKVKGSRVKGSLPATGGYVSMAGTVGANRFRTPGNDPHKGWMKTTNNAQEPHFVVLNEVQESTTNADVNTYISDSAGNPNPPPPSWALPAGTETNVISPGHTFVWKYAVPTGKYIAMCFWPSKTNAMPHFEMGMYRLFHMQ